MTLVLWPNLKDLTKKSNCRRSDKVGSGYMSMLCWISAWELAEDHFPMTDHPSLKKELMAKSCTVFDMMSGRRLLLQLHDPFHTLQIEPGSTKFGCFCPILKIDYFWHKGHIYSQWGQEKKKKGNICVDEWSWWRQGWALHGTDRDILRV